MEENAKALLAMNERTLAELIVSLDELERLVLIFEEEVERLRLIQTSLLVLKPDFALEDLLACFSVRELRAFFAYVSEFNLVEETYQNYSKVSGLLGTIRVGMKTRRVTWEDLALDGGSLCVRHQLSNYLFLLHAFGHELRPRDCLALMGPVIAEGQHPELHLKLDILRSKKQILREYQGAEFMDQRRLTEYTLVHELLLLITSHRVEQLPDLAPTDRAVVRSLRDGLESHQFWVHLTRLRRQEEAKKVVGICSRAHILTAVRELVGSYLQFRQARKVTWVGSNTLGKLCALSRLSVVASRLFTNELMDLKHEAGADDWRAYDKDEVLGKLLSLLDQLFRAEVNKFLGEEELPLLEAGSSLTAIHSGLQQAIKTQLLQQFDGRF